MMYELLEGRTHQLSVTGPELADIAELIASLTQIGGHAGPAGFKLFHALGFQKVYEESELAGSRQSCFKKVYKHSEDGTFQLTFIDSEYLSIANLLIWVIDLGGEADTIGRELFDALGFQHVFKEFINSPEGRDIFMRSSPEEGHA